MYALTRNEEEQKYGVTPVFIRDPFDPCGCMNCCLAADYNPLCEECLGYLGYGGYYVKSKV